MPTTPTQRSLRSSSSNTQLCLLDIKTLIEKSKTELLNTVKDEHAKLNNVIASLLSRIAILENKNTELEQRCKNLEQANAQVTQCQNEHGTAAEENLAFMLSECEDRKQRENNLIFSGVEEDIEGTVQERRSADEERVKKVLEHLKFDDINLVSVSRIGKIKAGKPRLLRAQMRNTALKKRVLAVSKNLRLSDAHRQVYINPDYTRHEQELQKKLRENLKKFRAEGKDVMIFRGKIINRADREGF